MNDLPDNQEIEKFKPLEIDPKVFRNDMLGKIKGMEEFMRKSKAAQEKTALEKLA